MIVITNVFFIKEMSSETPFKALFQNAKSGLRSLKMEKLSHIKSWQKKNPFFLNINVSIVTFAASQLTYNLYYTTLF